LAGIIDFQVDKVP